MSEEQIERTNVEEEIDFEAATEFVAKRSKAAAFAKIIEASGELFQMGEQIEQTDIGMVLQDLGVVDSDVSLTEEQRLAIREAMAEPIEELTKRLKGLEVELQDVLSDLEENAEHFSDKTDLDEDSIETIIDRAKQALS